MGNITTYFEKIIAKQKQMGYGFPSLLRPPANNYAVADAETQMSFRFNFELIELYSFADGTYLDFNTPLGKIGLIPIHRFLSFEEAVTTYRMQKVEFGFDSLFEEWATGYKPGEKLFPLLTDSGGNYYWVDLNEGTDGYGKIYWTNTFPCSPGYAFHSLLSMFKTIAEAYEEGVFFLDSEGYLDENSDRYYAIGKLNNPGLVFWNEEV